MKLVIMHVGLSLYFLKNCDYLLNNNCYPTSFDLLFYNYDFGCRYNLGLLSNNPRKAKWRHSHIIRYSQLNLNSHQCKHKSYKKEITLKVLKNDNFESLIYLIKIIIIQYVIIGYIHIILIIYHLNQTINFQNNLHFAMMVGIYHGFLDNKSLLLS